MPAINHGTNAVMKTFTLRRNATDDAMFEMWSEDERYLVAIIHEDHLGLMGKFGAGNYAELILVEEEEKEDGEWLERLSSPHDPE